MFEPVDGGGEDDAAALDGGVLVVAAVECAPVLYRVEEPFDDVAVLVVGGVLGDGSAAGAPARHDGPTDDLAAASASASASNSASTRSNSPSVN